MLLAPYQNKVAAIYVRFPTGLETEIRYGTFMEQRFVPGVPLSVFNRVRDSLAKIIVPAQSSFVDARDAEGNRRRSFANGAVEWIRKGRTELTEDIVRYGMRFAITREEPIAQVPNFRPTYTRNKTRYSYPLAGGAVQADLTESQDPDTKKITYEVELELTNRGAFASFAKAAESLLRLIQDTIVLYTAQDKREITIYYNQLLAGHRQEARLDPHVMKQQRNLKLKDMVWGGLIGNQETGYKVSHKVDGQRRQLIFAPNGIWLVLPPYIYTRLTSEEVLGLTGTVLDGESVDKDKRLGAAKELKKPYWYLVFDLLSFQGDTGFQKRSHSERMRRAQEVVNLFNSTLIEVNTMDFYSFGTAVDFYRVMREMFAREPSLLYERDGMVFTPEVAEYDPKVEEPVAGTEATKKVSVDKIPLKRRVLTMIPDNLKWKPPEQLTIDFRIRKDRNTIWLYTSDDDRTPFQGTPEYPFEGKISPIPEMLKETTHDIVEFRWDFDRKTFVPVRVRLNRAQPNRLEIVEDIWIDIHNPITSELLRGNTFGLFNYYMQRIHRGVIQSITGDVLLDLSPSHDREGWRNYNKIYAYEPDKVAAKALADALYQRGLNKKVTVIGDVDERVGRVDAIALTEKDYWRSKERFDKLVAIIDQHLASTGVVLFHVLNGDALDELFLPKLTPQLQVNLIELKSGEVPIGELSYSNGVMSFNGQQYYPAYIENLLVRLPQLTISEIHHGDTEEFLSLGEKILARMYSFGQLSNISRGPPTGPAARRPLPQRGVVRGRGAPARGASTRGRATRPVVPREIPLSTLTVITPRDPKNPGVGDDRSQKLTVTWFKEEVYRIACIGDGSCFFHAYLKGFYDDYQNNASYEHRYNIVRDFRDDLGKLLLYDDPDSPGYTYYETAANGAWVRMAEQQGISDKPLKDDYGIPLDYTLEGMVKLFLSSRDVGDETYSFVAEVVGIDVYVLRGTNKDLYTQTSTGSDRPRAIVIMGNGRHYEVIAVKRADSFQTLFDQDDEFIVAIRNKMFARA